MRGKGIGTSLMKRVLSDGDNAGLPVRLRVRADSPARNWYEQLGFGCIADEELNWHMERLPSAKKDP
jgi:ribosomal protein S18 acetylase RimI-like enzyme